MSLVCPSLNDNSRSMILNFDESHVPPNDITPASPSFLTLKTIVPSLLSYTSIPPV